MSIDCLQMLKEIVLFGGPIPVLRISTMPVDVNHKTKRVMRYHIRFHSKNKNLLTCVPVQEYCRSGSLATAIGRATEIQEKEGRILVHLYGRIGEYGACNVLKYLYQAVDLGHIRAGML